MQICEDMYEQVRDVTSCRRHSYSRAQMSQQEHSQHHLSHNSAKSLPPWSQKILVPRWWCQEPVTCMLAWSDSLHPLVYGFMAAAAEGTVFPERLCFSLMGTKESTI